ncbi:NERD domain-containing protein, partial [bacterium]|nr:NERD domain-containing protein [bacterium]
MIPPAIPPEMREKYDIPNSELRVFEELRRLPDDYTCIWSVPWADPESTKRSGEADFLIIHPRFPLTVIEVKGGQISCNQGKWTRFVRGQLEFAECPINQAHKSREALLRKFTRMNGFPQSLFVPSAIVVVLTDASRASLVGEKGYYSRVITIEDFSNFRQKLETAMSLPEEKLNRRNEGIGKVAAEFIRNFFSVSPSYKVPLRSLIDLDVDQLSRISKEHYLTINQLEKERKIIINGRAGTGKTVLAIQKAFRDAQLGRRTLLICFNEKLASSLSASIEQTCASIKKYITCCSYHQLCAEICIKNNEAIDDRDSNLKNHLEDLEFRAECLAIHEDSETESYQTIVVDEGQDFRENWWRVLESIFDNDSDGFFWIFRDEVQNIQQQSQFPLEGFFEFTLLKNFRNSQSVY